MTDTPEQIVQTTAGPWQKVGTFEPDPDATYLVQGCMFLSIKRGSEIDPDNMFAALIHLPAAEPKQLDDAAIISFWSSFTDPADNGYGKETRATIRALRAALTGERP